MRHHVEREARCQLRQREILSGNKRMRTAFVLDEQPVGGAKQLAVGELPVGCTVGCVVG